MAIIYRYVDLYDSQVKYVGIVYAENRSLEKRVNEHQVNDEWCKKGCWKVEYLNKKIENRTDAEFLESHYISKFGADKYYNKRKCGWGESKLIKDVDDKWSTYKIFKDNHPIKYNLPISVKKACSFAEDIFSITEQIFEYEGKKQNLLDLVKSIDEKLLYLYCRENELKNDESKKKELMQAIMNSSKTIDEVLAFLK